MKSGTQNIYRLSIALSILMLLLLDGIVLTACRPIRSLGKNPEGEDLKLIETLPNYKEGEFQNLERVASNPGPRRKASWTRMIKYLLSKPESAKPGKPVPVMLTNLRDIKAEKPVIVWFGHSSVLLMTKTANILMDPNFSGYAGPFRGLVNAFDGTTHLRLEDLPPIDILLISHDHYDHLDYATVKRLKKTVKQVVVPIGVGSHFRHWNFPPGLITEVQWHDRVQISDSLQIISTPAHHRSNRTFAQRKTLWSSYVIKAGGYTLYFSGDTGYSKHFNLIGEQYGPFDLALLECGQYNVKWPHNHMFPWQTTRAAKDLRASLIIPIHWAKFAESTHPWNEPVKILQKSADSLQIPFYTPYIGQPYALGDPFEKQTWWDFE